MDAWQKQRQFTQTESSMPVVCVRLLEWCVEWDIRFNTISSVHYCLRQSCLYVVIAFIGNELFILASQTERFFPFHSCICYLKIIIIFSIQTWHAIFFKEHSVKPKKKQKWRENNIKMEKKNTIEISQIIAKTT